MSKPLTNKTSKMESISQQNIKNINNKIIQKTMYNSITKINTHFNQVKCHIDHSTLLFFYHGMIYLPDIEHGQM